MNGVPKIAWALALALLLTMPVTSGAQARTVGPKQVTIRLSDLRVGYFVSAATTFRRLGYPGWSVQFDRRDSNSRIISAAVVASDPKASRAVFTNTCRVYGHNVVWGYRNEEESSLWHRIGDATCVFGNTSWSSGLKIFVFRDRDVVGTVIVQGSDIFHLAPAGHALAQLMDQRARGQV